MPGNPRIETPNTDSALGPNRDPGRSLVEELGEVVDEMRQLATDLGLRPYRVFSVTVRWTGGAAGNGEPVLVSERELLPTPKLVVMAVRAQASPAGKLHRGTVQLRQVSPRYTEDEVRGLFFRCELPAGHQGFIEVRADARDGATARRRFTVVDVPFHDAGAFEWRVTLSAQQVDRTRAGALKDDVSSPAEVQMHRFDDEG